MFFEDDRFHYPEFLPDIDRVYAIREHLKTTTNSMIYIPTHTEDGIPIRKLYISNLPPKTTRSELFGIFAQYGFIKSCWLRMGDRGGHKMSTPAYAFVTYGDPADAHKALRAPPNETAIRGRNLRVMPADSWHQPSLEADGVVQNNRNQRRDPAHGAPTNEQHTGGQTVADPDTSNESNLNDADATTSSAAVSNPEETARSDPFTILEILNTDCLSHILAFVPLRDVIRSERVSKSWQAMVREYLRGVRTFKTSWWQHVPRMLTTAVLRRVLRRVGRGLARLHIDHHWSALNDRTAHTVGKFCPNLEEIKIVGMHTRNWNPLMYGCKQLKSLSFVSCNKLQDANLVHLLRNDSSIESFTIANNTHVTGLFLTGSSPRKLSSLCFYNCYSLQATVLCAAIDNLPGLTSLSLDVCPITMWQIIPLILNKLPKLEALSLSEYTNIDTGISPQSTEAFCDAIANLTELKSLNLSRNIYITNEVLKRVAQHCPKLEVLNVSCCNSSRRFPGAAAAAGAAGVGDEGVAAACRGCRALRRLDVSYLAALGDAGARAAAALPRLRRLLARGNPALSAAPLLATLAACPLLEEVDVCGCDSVSDEVVECAVRVLQEHPRPLTLRLAGTAAGEAANMTVLPTHKLLTVDLHEDRSNPHLRPDYADRTYEDSSDDSLEDIYDHERFDDFYDDEMFLEDELEAYEGILQFRLHAPDILLL